MRTYATVTGVITFGKKVLLLRRNPDRRTHPNKWQTISGSIKEKEPAEDAILREIMEETGLDGAIVKMGAVFEVRDNGRRWVTLPFLITVSSEKVKLNMKEHSEYKWVKPEEVIKFDCATGTVEDLKSVGLL